MGAAKGSLGTVLGGAAGFAVGGPMGAMIGAGLGGSIGGGMDAQAAAKSAAKTQSQAANAAIEEQRAAREQIAQQLAPYVGAGTAAQSQLLNYLGLVPTEQQSAYDAAKAYKPTFSEEQRAAILKAGPAASQQMVPTAAPSQQLGGARPTAGRWSGMMKARGIPAVQPTSQATSQYQQALAEQEQIKKNQATISQFEAMRQSPQFGMFNQDVTQGLPSVMPANIEQDSLFQSLKRQAISGIEGSAAARGKLMAGTTPQAIAEQVQNLALGRAGQIQAQNLAARQQLFGERTGEQQRLYNQLFGLVGTGQASAAQQAANIQGAASNVGEYMTQAANAQAAGRIGAANAQAQMYQGLLGAGTTLGTAQLMGGGNLFGGPGPKYVSPQSQLGNYYIG